MGMPKTIIDQRLLAEACRSLLRQTINPPFLLQSTFSVAVTCYYRFMQVHAGLYRFRRLVLTKLGSLPGWWFAP